MINKIKRLGLILLVGIYPHLPNWSNASLNDMAIFSPGVNNWMTPLQQNDVANYLTDITRFPQAIIFTAATQAALVTWLNEKMSDGKSDVLLIVDLAPQLIFNDNENSLVEQWIENGNMLIWTGSEPFHSSVDATGTVADHTVDGTNNGANKVLDIKGEGLTTGYASEPQQYTSVSSNEIGFHNYLPSLNLNYSGSDMRSLKYVDLLTESQAVVSWDDSPNIVIDEIFAENRDGLDTTHVYESDAIVLTMRQSEADRKGYGGQYAQFYCYKGLVDGLDSNEYRKPVLAEFLGNWLAQDIRHIWVEAGTAGGNGSEASPFSTIQAGIDAANEFSRDRVMVKAGIYSETLTTKRSVKLISAGEDVRINTVGHLNDYGNPEINYTYNTFAQVNGKRGLTRAENTIIDGAGLSAGVPMVDVPKGATLGTWLDGFTIQNMPEIDHTVCGAAHTVQNGGSSAIVIDNILRNNGSGGLGSRSVFDRNTSGASVENDICLNDDYSFANVKYNTHPALINNIVAESKGPNLENSHYSYGIMYHNEGFRSGYYGGNQPMVQQEAPGIGSRHGAHPYIYNNVVYESSWTGIDSRRGENKVEWAVTIDRPTRPTVKGNYVFDSGKAIIDDFGAGIGGSNTGGFDPYSGYTLYHLIENNFISVANDAGVYWRYWEEEDGFGTSVPKDSVGFVAIRNNTSVGATHSGIGIHGAHDGAEILHNEVTENTREGILLTAETNAGKVNDNYSHNNLRGGIVVRAGSQVSSINNNFLILNKLVGIDHVGHNNIDSPNRVYVTEEIGNTIDSNGGGGISLNNTQVDLISLNTIRYNPRPGIAVIGGSDVGLIEGSASTEGPERLSQNGRSDQQDPCTLGFTAGLVIEGEGSSANISNLIIEESGSINVAIGPGTEVTMNGCKVRNNNYDSDDFPSEDVTPTGGPGMRVDGVATITNNLFENAGLVGVAIMGGAVVSFNDNIVSGSGAAGMAIDNAELLSFSGNTLSQNALAGLALGSLNGDLNIENSTIDQSGTAGIISEYLYYNVTISDSYVTNSTMIGLNLRFADYTKNFNVSNTEITGSGTIAVWVEDCGDVSITNSNISENSAGVFLVNNNNSAAKGYISNCVMDRNQPGNDIDMKYGSELSVYDTMITGSGLSADGGPLAVQVRYVDSVDIARVDLMSWNVGLSMDNVAQANVSQSILRSRWPAFIKNETNANFINNITESKSDGILVYHNSTANFYHNTLWNSGLFGVAARFGSTISAYNNIITGAANCLKAWDTSEVTADYNIFNDCKNVYKGSYGGGGLSNIGANNMIGIDPQLVDPINGDFHLQPTSAAIDAGSSGWGVANDMDNDARSMGSGHDIGADEAN